MDALLQESYMENYHVMKAILDCSIAVPSSAAPFNKKITLHIKLLINFYLPFYPNNELFYEWMRKYYLS